MKLLILDFFKNLRHFNLRSYAILLFLNQICLEVIKIQFSIVSFEIEILFSLPVYFVSEHHLKNFTRAFLIVVSPTLRRQKLNDCLFKTLALPEYSSSSNMESILQNIFNSCFSLISLLDWFSVYVCVYVCVCVPTSELSLFMFLCRNVGYPDRHSDSVRHFIANYRNLK